MPIIDERGRIFGRVNLVDFAVGALVLVLLPTAYAAYLIFREPTPKLTGIAPDTLRQGPNLQIEIRGVNLRPYMRVSFNGLQGRTFLFSNPNTAVVELPDMPAGKYDVILYDYMQEVSRLPGAFTLARPPDPPVLTVEVSGVLTGLAPEQVAQLQPGHRFPEIGGNAELLSVGASQPEVLRIKTGDKAVLSVPVKGPVQLPVRLRTNCYIVPTSDGALHCAVNTISLAPDVNVQLQGLGTTLNLRVSEVHYAGTSRTASIVVRFAMSPEARALLRPADEDVGGLGFPSGRKASLVSFTDRGEVTAAMLRDDRVHQAVPTSRLVAVDAVLAVPVDDTPIGISYKSTIVKVGAPFTFETAGYTISGGVIDVKASPTNQ